MPTSTTFRGFAQLGSSTLTEIIRANVISFIDWGLVDKGGYFNVLLTQSGVYGGDFSRLRPVSDPRYTTGTVWEAQNNNWVWESGTSIGNPIAISGVWVNGSLLPHSGYTVDYPNGRIVFDEPRSLSSTVRVEHSYKYVYVTDARSVSVLRSVYPRSWMYDGPNFFVGSGQYSQLADQRIQLPAVAVEIGGISHSPYELGTGNRYVRTDVVCHVLAESEIEGLKLADALSYQNEKTIHLYDTNRLASEDRFPLTAGGDIAEGCLTYPQLVSPTGDGGFRYGGTQGGQLRLHDVDVEMGQWLDNSLYRTAVRFTTQVIQLHLD